MKDIKPAIAQKQKRPAFEQGVVDLVCELVIVTLLRSEYEGEDS
ncbi:hypothetical protein SBX64_16095 [Vibrio rhizosphaerae]|uniref:Uncharacterized protein n=1 Tax=Vibrio rhizosphaerae TaxID=398736 RepID=A0ABU4IXD5_9VIBR|nr:hypothetical protein [Vibrio rhizosphaerae]MDW6094061.1 hypothetical protein [Vibrio rhizosphaerae]